MRFTSLRMWGLLNFPNEVSVDFEKLPPIVAITGKNGAGKSTFIRALVAGVRRAELQMAALARLGGREEGGIEVGLAAERAWRVRHRVDSASGKAQSEAFDDAGRMVLGKPSVREFDAWAARTLPDPEVLLAGPIAMQSDGGFIRMTPGDRQDVILRAIAAAKHDGWATDARERARQKQEALSVVEARLGDERRRAGVVGDEAEGSITALVAGARSIETAIAEADEAVEAARASLQRAEGLERGAAEALDAMRADAAQIATRNAEIAARRAEIAAAEQARSTAVAHLGRLQAQRDSYAAILGDAVAIRASIATAAALDVQITKLGLDVAEQRAAWTAANQRDTETAAALKRAKVAESDAVAKAADATERGKQRAEAARDADGLPAAREALAQAEQAHAASETEVERLHALAASGAAGRITGLRGGLSAIDGLTRDDDLGDAVALASDTLFADNDTAAALAKLPDDQREANQARGLALRAKYEADALVRRLEARKALAEAPHDDDAPATALTAAVEARQIAAAQSAGAIIDAETIKTRGTEARAQLEKLQAARALEFGPGKADALARAEATSAQLGTEIEQAERALEQATAKLAELGPAPEPTASLDMPAAERIARDATRATADARAACAEAERRQGEIAASATRLAEIEAERLAVANELGDWNALAADIKLVQAMLVDGIGPDLTETANDLIHHCVGPRFTVNIETQRLSADGSKTLETCTASVFDTRKGTTQDVDTLSGGEGVLVGTPMRLALAAKTCRTWGIKRPTIILDEAGAALDKDLAAVPFVAMLRRAAKQLGASQILFVSHNAEAQALADARLHIENGRITVN